MTHDIRKFMNLMEQAQKLDELDLAPTAALAEPEAAEKEVEDLPLDQLDRDEAGRAKHDHITMTAGKDSVVAQLTHYESGRYTNLAKKVLKIKELKSEIEQLEEDVKAGARTDIADLFAATDIAFTRVVETRSFILKLTKNPSPTTTVQYAKVLKDLEASLTPELIAVLNTLKSKYSSSVTKAAALSVVARESVMEGMWDKIKDVLARLLATITNWAEGFDAKLSALKMMAGIYDEAPALEMSEGINHSNAQFVVEYEDEYALCDTEETAQTVVRALQANDPDALVRAVPVSDVPPGMMDELADAQTITMHDLQSRVDSGIGNSLAHLGMVIADEFFVADDGFDDFDESLQESTDFTPGTNIYYTAVEEHPPGNYEGKITKLLPDGEARVEWKRGGPKSGTNVVQLHYCTTNASINATNAMAVKESTDFTPGTNIYYTAVEESPPGSYEGKILKLLPDGEARVEWKRGGPKSGTNVVQLHHCTTNASINATNAMAIKESDNFYVGAGIHYTAVEESPPGDYEGTIKKMMPDGEAQVEWKGRGPKSGSNVVQLHHCATNTMINKANEPVAETVDYGRIDRIEKQVEYMAKNGRSRAMIVANIGEKMGSEEADYAADYYDQNYADMASEANEPAMQQPKAMSESSLFGFKYLKESEEESDESEGDDSEEGEDDELSETDLGENLDPLTAEFDSFMSEATPSSMAFRNGSTVYCGSRQGVVVGMVPNHPNSLLVELPNGEMDAFPKNKTTDKKPNLIKKAFHAVVGESEIMEAAEQLTVSNTPEIVEQYLNAMLSGELDQLVDASDMQHLDDVNMDDAVQYLLAGVLGASNVTVKLANQDGDYVVKFTFTVDDAKFAGMYDADAGNASCYQTQMSEAVLSEKIPAKVPEYGTEAYGTWNIKFRTTPKNGKYEALGMHPRNPALPRGAGTSTEQAINSVKEQIDKLVANDDTVLKYTKGQVNLNADFTRECLENGPTGIRLDRVGDETILTVCSEEFADLGPEVFGPGPDQFTKLQVRMPGNSDEGGSAAQLYGVGISTRKIRELGLQANGRYSLQHVGSDPDYGHQKFKLVFDSITAGPHDKVRLGVPALTLAVY